MTEERRPFIEGMLDRTARRLSGSGLHPLEILQAVREAAEASVRDGMVANELVIGLNPSDFAAFGGSALALRQEIDRLLDDFERERGLRRLSERDVRIEPSATAESGAPAVVARFVARGHPAARAAGGPTREILRLRGKTLVLEDGTRAALTHVPFGIGRGPGNDLVLASFAVSRRHAEVADIGGRLVLRDLGSRNGITVAGQRVHEIALEPGVRVTVGDVTFWLEETS